jgi:hypothetical protein
MAVNAELAALTASPSLLAGGVPAQPERNTNAMPKHHAKTGALFPDVLILNYSFSGRAHGSALRP